MTYRDALKIIGEDYPSDVKRAIDLEHQSLEKWKKHYYDLADAVSAESTDTADLCRQARVARAHRDALKAALLILLDASENGLFDAEKHER